MRNGRIMLAVAGAVVLVLAALSGPAPAATWIGTASGTWSDANNWSGGVIADGPQSTANLSTIDPNVATGDITVTIDGAVASRTLGILTIGDTNNTNSYTLAGSGGGTLTLDNYGLAAQLNQTATSKGDTLNNTLPIRLASNLEIRNSSANGLAVNGGISAIYGGAKIISNLGTGISTVTLGGNITDGTGRVYVTQNSANSVLALTGANTYTGWTTITAGVLRANNGAGLPANSCLILNGGVLEASGTFARNINNNYGKVYWAANGGFAAYGGDLTVTLNGGGPIDWANNPQGFNGKTLIFGSTTATNNVTVTNNINLKGDRTIQVNDNTGSLTDVAEFSGILADGDATARKLTKTGTGVLVLSGANTYTGATTVSAGALRVTGSNSSAAGTTVGGGTLQMAGGTLASGALALNTGFIEAYGASRSVSNTITWGGNFGFAGSQNLDFTSTTAVATGARTITVSNTGVTTMSTPWTYSGNCVFAFGNGSGNLVVNGNVQLNAGNRTFTVNPTGTAGALLINGAVTQDVAGRTLTMAGTGTLVLAGNDTYTGLTTVSAGTLTLSGNNTAATGGVTLTAGALNVNSATALGTGTVILTAGTLDNTSGSAKALTLNNAVTLNGNFAFSTAAGTAANNLTFGTGAVTNAGNRTLALNGTGTTLTFGGVMTNTSNAVQTTTVNGAGNTLVLGGYALSNSATSYVNVITGSGNVTITGAVTNGGTATASGLTYSGTGTLTLSGVNTYAGATAVNAGRLKVDGSINSSAVTVTNAGSVLAGDGSVKSLAMGAGTIVAPGGSVGDLAVVAGNCSLAAGTVYQWELGAASNDVVNITGALTLDDAWKLKLVDAGGTPNAFTQYNLFTYTGAYTGLATFGLGNIDVSGVTWDTSAASIVAGGGLVYITGIAPTPGMMAASESIPEPGSAMLLIFGAAALIRRRRISGAA